jgi:zinc metalloprotease ZmpA
LNLGLRSVKVAGALAAGLITVGVAAVVQASPPSPSPSDVEARSQAAKSADAYVAGRPQVLRASSGEAFVQHQVISSAGLHYVPYDRTYQGLPGLPGG